MVIRTPATPSNANEATTDDQARGGLFTDTNGVGIDLSGLVGPEGPQGPTGPRGATGATGAAGQRGEPGERGERGFSVTSVSQVENQTDRHTTLTFNVATESGVEEPIDIRIVVPWGRDGVTPDANFNDTVNVTTLAPTEPATARLDGDGTPGSPYTLVLGIPRGADGNDGMDGANGDTFIPVFFNPAGDPTTWDATTTLAQGSTFFSYVPLSNTDVFTRGTIDSFDAERFRTFEQNGHFGRHTLGGVEGDSVSGVTISGPTSVPEGNRYSITVAISNAAGTFVRNIDAGTFIAPEGPGGTGSGDTFQSDDGSVDIQEVSNNVYSFTVPQLGNANEIRGSNIPALPTDAGEFLIEYIPGTGLQWVRMPTGITVDTALSSTSTNAVENRAIQAGLDLKQDTLQFDTTPTAGSSNPVTSQGIDAALDLKLTITDIDNLVEHTNTIQAVSSDNIADVFDHTIFDTDLVTDTNGLVTGIMTGGELVHQTDSAGNTEYMRTGGTPVTLAGEDNVQADYAETDTAADSFILNKPVLTTINTELTTDPAMAGEWTIRTGDVTSVDNDARIIVLGASSGPTPHARLNTVFALSDTSHVEDSFLRVMGTASASISAEEPGDVVTRVEFVSGSLSSTLRTIAPGAAGTTSTAFTFDIQPGDTPQVITFTGMYRVTATVNGDESTTTHSFTASITIAPNWGILVATDVPSDFSNNQGAFAVGDMVTVTGVDGGVIYVWVPTSSVMDGDPFFTTDNPNIFYSETNLGITSGDHTLFSLGTATSGTYIVRVGGV